MSKSSCAETREEKAWNGFSDVITASGVPPVQRSCSTTAASHFRMVSLFHLRDSQEIPDLFDPALTGKIPLLPALLRPPAREFRGGTALMIQLHIDQELPHFILQLPDLVLIHLIVKLGNNHHTPRTRS